jgi:hypothetical protein
MSEDCKNTAAALERSGGGCATRRGGINRQQLAREVARIRKVELIEVRRAGVCEPTLLVVSTGSGLLMATLDHLAEEYPHAGLLGADLPGALDGHERALVLDYLSAVWPTVLVVWASLRDPCPMFSELSIRRAGSRLKDHPVLWVYHRGLGAGECEFPAPAQAGVRIINDLWAPKPLGSVET